MFAKTKKKTKTHLLYNPLTIKVDEEGNFNQFCVNFANMLLCRKSINDHAEQKPHTAAMSGGGEQFNELSITKRGYSD